MTLPLGRTLDARQRARRHLDRKPVGRREGELFLVCTGTFTCSNSATFLDAWLANAINPNSSVGDIGYYRDANGNPILARGPAQGPSRRRERRRPPRDPPGADCLRRVLPLDQFPLQAFSKDGGVITYRPTISSTAPAKAPVPQRSKLSLPPGLYVRLTVSTTSAVALRLRWASRCPGPSELEWDITGIALRVQQHLSFQLRPGLDLGTETATRPCTPEGSSTPAPDPAKTRYSTRKR